jgi:putative PIN family toxin of toxin-antitoxin system
VKVVLDTNVFLSGIFWAGTASEVLNLWAKDRVEVIVSPFILEEYERILGEMDQRRPGQSDFWRLFIVQFSTLIHPREMFRLCRDPKDNMFLDCAVAGGAKYLVSGDKDLLMLKGVAGVKILSPAEFLKKF